MPGRDLLARQHAMDLLRSGDLLGAEAIYKAILAEVPQDSDALHLSGVAALQRGDTATAIARIEQAVTYHPLPLYLANLGAALRRANRTLDAVAVLRRAVSLDPMMGEARCNLASALCSQGAWEEALMECSSALALQPNLAAAYLNRALAFTALHKPELAEVAARQALASQPDWPEALLSLGAALLEQERLAEAILAYQAALALRPHYVAALTNMGVALTGAGRREEAATALQTAATLAPTQPEVLLNLGTALQGLGRLSEARESQETILAQDPLYWAAWSNLAAILHFEGELAEAEAAWQHSLELHPDQPDARYSRALNLLLAGDYARGWEALEYRWQATQHRGRARHTHLPLWTGEDLTGRTILLHAEEGLGDTIHFARYVPLVAARGGKVVLETYAPLARLFAGLDGVEHLAVQGEALPEAHLQCPLQSLPRAFGTRIKTIPAAVPYLRPDATALHRWKRQLTGSGKRIALVWAGSATHGLDHERSIAFSRLAPLWQVPCVRWFSVQVGARATDLASAPPGTVEDLSPALTDFAETAAALCAMDLLISVDTSVAHLGGALGKPVWLLLPTTPDWRWLLGRDDSPWYPTMRLFRQTRAGDWEGVIARVAAALAA